MSGELSVADSVLDGSATQATGPSWSSWSDWAGMVASIGCAIHCAAMPFVIAYLPMLGLSFLADEAFHKWMAVGCFAIALTAFVPGFRKHGRLLPVIIGSVGLVMISIAAFGLAGECCAACESKAASAAWSSSNLSVASVPSDAQPACTDGCCPHCASEATDGGDAAASSTTAVARVSVEASVVKEPVTKPSVDRFALAALPMVTPASSQILTRLAPWLTPLGGIVLVIAHLLNRRYGCLCGCCDPEASLVTG